MTRRFVGPGRSRARRSRHRNARRASSTAAAVWLAASLCAAAPAAADSSDTLASAVTAVRGISCGPLHANPIVQQAANEINDSNDKWLDHASRAVPAPEATPLLKDLGYGGNRSMLLTSALPTVADAIKAVVLQGYRAIPDCSYVDYGVSMLHNASKDLILTTVVLAA